TGAKCGLASAGENERARLAVLLQGRERRPHFRPELARQGVELLGPRESQRRGGVAALQLDHARAHGQDRATRAGRSPQAIARLSATTRRVSAGSITSSSARCAAASHGSLSAVHSSRSFSASSSAATSPSLSRTACNLRRYTVCTPVSGAMNPISAL